MVNMVLLNACMLFHKYTEAIRFIKKNCVKLFPNVQNFVRLSVVVFAHVLTDLRGFKFQARFDILFFNCPCVVRGQITYRSI